jgi:hypothetical protein
MQAAGLDVRVRDELFKQDTEDIVWLREAGRQRWVVVTRDDRIRYNASRNKRSSRPVSDSSA